MRLRLVLSALLTGALMVGAAWAAVGLTPVGVQTPEALEGAPSLRGARVTPSVDVTLQEAALELGADQVLAGASKVNIYPNPPEGEVWQREGCATLDPSAIEQLPDTRLPWAESPDCIYTGGYGIGPSNAVTDFDTTYGLWTRSLAISDGSDTVVLTILDGTSYFGHYGGRLCDDCGAFDLAEQLSGELEIPASNFVFASTHSHTAPDFIGGWGGVPDWYMQQVADAMRTSVREAVNALTPAVLEAGEVLARPLNSERRNTYRSAEDQTLSWLRAVDTASGNTIATMGAYAAHPTTVGFDPWIAHADWPVLFEKRLEDRFGGVGLHFMSGLGNMSARGGVDMGTSLADLVPDIGSGTVVRDADVRAAQQIWNQPGSNAALTALGAVGGFDRRIDPAPGTTSVGKSQDKQCRSTSPVSIRTGVSAMKIGDVLITAAPGEIFSNLSNTIEERSPIAAFAMAQANDGLGYIMQSIEYDPAAGQGLGFVYDDIFEYEDAYAIDRCFGDMVLETTLSLINQL